MGAVRNIVRNAVQAAGNAPVRIELFVTWEHADLLVAIDDAGPGVPPGDRERVFEHGYTTRGGGLGYGLHHAREVIERDLGGTIVFEAAPLGGARLAIRLPPDSTRRASADEGAHS